MSNSIKNPGRIGMGIKIGLINFLILLTLKVAQVGVVANWPWWAVTSSLWVPIVVVLLVATILSIINKVYDIVS